MSIKTGTCSWNYDSWVGLVYSGPQRRAADYLPEYSRSFDTAEIDSWFYRMPPREEVRSYAGLVPETFSFTCKVPSALTRPLLRGDAEEKNPEFLSPELFEAFLETTEPLHDRLDALIFQFEYLNRRKMSGLTEFMERFGTFRSRWAPEIPVAVEIRNGAFLTADYFRFLSELNIIPVLAEKQYMPPVSDVYERFGTLFGDRLVIRLMGGDRKEIEKISGGSWNRLVMEKSSLSDIITMITEIVPGKRVTINVNNHYEGSAPLTIRKLKAAMPDLFPGRGPAFPPPAG